MLNRVEGDMVNLKNQKDRALQLVQAREQQITRLFQDLRDTNHKVVPEALTRVFKVFAFLSLGFVFLVLTFVFIKYVCIFRFESIFALFFHFEFVLILL